MWRDVYKRQADSSAGGKRLELGLEFQLGKGVDRFGYMHMVAVGDVALIGYAFDKSYITNSYHEMCIRDRPKGLAIIAEFGGTAVIKDTKKKREIIITNKETAESKAYLIPYGSRIKIVDGQEMCIRDR